jgi:hypothetical protein
VLPLVTWPLGEKLALLESRRWEGLPERGVLDRERDREKKERARGRKKKAEGWVWSEGARRGGRERKRARERERKGATERERERFEKLQDVAGGRSEWGEEHMTVVA